MKYGFLLLVFLFLGCHGKREEHKASMVTSQSLSGNVSLIILGTIQDGGSPHIGCQKECCKALWEHPNPTRKVVSLGVVDYMTSQTFLFEATPHFSEQTHALSNFAKEENSLPDGIFLTHAHIGHYTGLMYLGKEAINASNVPVYVMPRMKEYLESNGPWSQLVDSQNITLQSMTTEKETALTPQLKVIPFLVPHRDEFSETAGYKIIGPNKSVLFIPDIDKWDKWDKSIIEEIAKVDYAFLDATFFHGKEINTRNISEIPHPFIEESMDLFKDLPKKEKEKIHFIHFNHTNPVLDPKGNAHSIVLESGFHLSRIYDTFNL